MKKQVMTFVIALLSLAAYAQHDHSAHAGHDQAKGTPAFQDEKIGAAYEKYIILKDALVASNKDDAKKAATELQKSLAPISSAKEAAATAEKISSAPTIDEQRKSFSSLSNQMTALLKASKLASGSVYVAYCPMANNNEGAFWLSNEKQIKNPYFGDMMLTCGSVKETLQ